MILEEVGRLVDVEEDYPEALRRVTPYVTDNPKCSVGLYLMGRALLLGEQPVLAELVYQRALGVDPRWQGVVELGRAYADQHRYDEAEAQFRLAHDMAPHHVLPALNISNALIAAGKPAEGLQWAERALELDPGNENATLNMGFAHLALRNYGVGWDYYATGMGHHEWRVLKRFSGEPVWNGTKGKRIAIYAEQGLGDQILMAEPIHDVCEDAAEVVVECHPKLVGLFARSFPKASVYGTQFDPSPQWAEDGRLDASISFSQLQCLYRRKAEDWSGRPYLTPDPERALQWKVLLHDIEGKKRIGFGWTGGSQKTQKNTRSAALDDWSSLIRHENVNVSLEYRDPEPSAILDRLHQWPRANQTKDLDDQAGLVAALDLVIAVPTTVVHLAGALGVPCVCLVHDTPQAFLGAEGDRMPVYGDTVKLLRRHGPGWGVIERAREYV